MFQGYLKVMLQIADGAVPISGESVYVKTQGFTQNDDMGFNSSFSVDERNYDYRLTTDASGTTQTVAIEAPDPAMSQNEFDNSIPYSVVDIYTNVPGYYPVRILNAQIYANQISVLPIRLTPLSKDYTNAQGGTIVYAIPPNALLTTEVREHMSFPEDVAESLVVGEVTIPEYVTVHLGRPNQAAENVYVSFPDYVKNVASSEIFPTWPEETLRANILAIVSLTLNRIFTEWYPSQGYDFDITNSTQFDQSFVPGRNIFENISRLVDELFNTYIVRIGYISPLFAAYCDGRRTTCNGMLQWGSERLGSQGYTALAILKYYYGNDIELQTTDNISDITRSYPGYPLSLGAEGPEVEWIRRQLYRISFNYPLIPRINPVLRVFDSGLDSAVRTFQEIFDLAVDGIVGKATWYRISYVYSSILKLGELTSGGETGGIPTDPPTETVQRGNTSRAVARLQFILAYISLFYTNISTPALDGIFGAGTEASVRQFQEYFGLPVTGIVTAQDWQRLYEVYNSVLETVAPSLGEQGYPGTPLRRGSRGDSVRLIQTYLNTISDTYPIIPKIEADGVFGQATENAVRAFQQRFFIQPTGVVDAATWGQIVEEYNFLTRQN